jgi:hypothetical protein
MKKKPIVKDFNFHLIWGEHLINNASLLLKIIMIDLYLTPGLRSLYLATNSCIMSSVYLVANT